MLFWLGFISELSANVIFFDILERDHELFKFVREHTLAKKADDEPFATSVDGNDGERDSGIGFRWQVRLQVSHAESRAQVHGSVEHKAIKQKEILSFMETTDENFNILPQNEQHDDSPKDDPENEVDFFIDLIKSKDTDSLNWFFVGVDSISRESASGKPGKEMIERCRNWNGGKPRWKKGLELETNQSQMPKEAVPIQKYICE